jgi:hypothetical protein
MIGNTKQLFGKQYGRVNLANSPYVNRANWRGGLFWAITLIM